MQEIDSIMSPIAYAARKLTSAEVNYTTTEQELLAIVYCFQQWRCYLEGSDVILHTDHEPLTWLATQKTLSRRQARWMEYLAQFTYALLYVKGDENVVADALSRMLTDNLSQQLSPLPGDSWPATILANRVTFRSVRHATKKGLPTTPGPGALGDSASLLHKESSMSQESGLRIRAASPCLHSPLLCAAFGHTRRRNKGISGMPTSVTGLSDNLCGNTFGDLSDASDSRVVESTTLLDRARSRRPVVHTQGLQAAEGFLDTSADMETDELSVPMSLPTVQLETEPPDGLYVEGDSGMQFASSDRDGHDMPRIDESNQLFQSSYQTLFDTFIDRVKTGFDHRFRYQF